jgi:hypothetical protein
MALDASTRIALAFALAVAGCVATARAQSLQRLTVTALSLSADATTPHVEVPFHLIVTAHIRERVAELDNIDLPILAELELLGDEHALTADANGTTYRETITVVAHHSGAITIAPVTLDAIDARDGRPKRYSSNALTLNVMGGLAAVPSAKNTSLVSWSSILVALAIVLAIVTWTLRHRQKPVPAPALQPVVITLPPPVPVDPDPRARVREWLDRLRAHPTRETAMSVRSAVRRTVGAGETETLTDVLRRPLAQKPAMQRALRALERAGFTHDGDLATAVRGAIAALEEMAR